MKYDCFLNLIKREKTIAKLNNLNYYILNAQRNGNTSVVEILTKFKENYKNKVLKNFNELMSLLSKYTKGEELTSKETSDINKIKSKYYSQTSFVDFYKRFVATYESVANGKEVSFYKISNSITQNLDFVFSTDVVINLIGQEDLDDELFTLYYAGGITKNDMPIFINKELKEKYDNFIKEKTNNEPIEFRSLEGDFKKLYITERNEHKQKELYEAVFPEFNLKYEDRDSETTKIYTMDWSNNDK